VSTSNPSSTAERTPRAPHPPRVPVWMTRSALFTVMALAAAYFLLPVWWLVVTATKRNGYLFNTNNLWFSHFDLLGNIRAVFSQDDGIYGRWLLNSLIYAVGGAAAATALAAMAGYALSKYQFRGREAIFNSILGAVLIPAPLFALPLYLMFSKVGLVDTYWAVLIPSTVSPFGVYLARIYSTAAVPDELIDAARIDGAHDVRIFRTIAMPIMTPALVTVFLFQFVTIWSNYLLPSLMLANANLQPVTEGLVNWQAIRGAAILPYNVVITGALISVVPIVAMFLCLQRFWRTGLTTGSVK